MTEAEVEREGKIIVIVNKAETIHLVKFKMNTTKYTPNDLEEINISVKTFVYTQGQHIFSLHLPL